MTARFDGVTLVIGGGEYVIPPLSFRQLKKLRPALESLGASVIDANNLTEAQIDAVASIVFEALSRNHPELTQDVVLDMLDLGNIAFVLQAVMGVSGLKKAAAAAPSP